eukprot:FR742713.1.p1 GENE.FR742713.1~~FR742713.1.p1  ORF type:complete len:144 (+),score=14.73 FR742713.1:64-432(+)
MDQTNAVLKVKTAVPRDVKPEDVDAMILKLTAWRDSVEKILQSMAASQEKARTTRDLHAKKKLEVSAAVEDCKKNLKDRLPADYESRGRFHDEMMDVDKPNRRLASRGKRSRGHTEFTHSRS